MADLETRHDDGVLWLTLHRPAAANALTGDMVLGLFEQLRSASGRDDVAVVVLTGSGAAFSAGADLAGEHPERGYDARSVDAATEVVRAITVLDKPVVCGLNGVAAGVGLSFALACDLVVARASARVTSGFTRIGLMPDGGATATLAAAVGRARAMRLSLLSEVLTASEAYDAGLVSHVFPDDEWEAGLADIVDRLRTGARLALAATKKAVNAATLDALPEAFARERAGQPALLRTDDVVEGMQAFAEGRSPRFRGS